MTHRGLRRRLSAYLDGALAPGQRRRAEAHLAGCAPCRTELAALRRTLSLLHAQRSAEPAPPELLQRINRRLAAGEGAPPRSRLRRALPAWRDLQRGWIPPLAACAAALALLLALDSVEIRVRLPWPAAGRSTPQQQASGGAPSLPAPAAAPAPSAQGLAAAPQANNGRATQPLAAGDRTARPSAQSLAAAPPANSGRATQPLAAAPLAGLPAGPGRAAQAQQRGGSPVQSFATGPRRPQGPVRTASSQSPAAAKPVALGQRREPGAPPALLRVLRCAGQPRGLGCLRLQSQWVGLALSDPRAFTTRLEEVPDPAQARWIADLSRFAVRRGTALQVISRLRGAGDPRAERLAARFEESAARSTP